MPGYSFPTGTVASAPASYQASTPDRAIDGSTDVSRIFVAPGYTSSVTLALPAPVSMTGVYLHAGSEPSSAVSTKVYGQVNGAWVLLSEASPYRVAAANTVFLPFSAATTVTALRYDLSSPSAWISLWETTYATAAPSASYDSLVYNSGAMQSYKLDEASSATSFASAGSASNAATLGGSALNRTSALHNGSLSGQVFAGTSYLEVPGSNTSFDGAFALEAWVKPAQVSTQMGIVEKYGTGAEYRGYTLRMNAGGYVQAGVIAADNSYTAATTTTPLEVGKTYHLVARLGTDHVMTVFVNGVPVATQASVPFPVSVPNVPMTIGARAQSRDFRFNGTLDSVAVYGYGKNLTNADVLAHYNAGK
jgi:hypothetical protein